MYLRNRQMMTCMMKDTAMPMPLINRALFAGYIQDCLDLSAA